MNNEQIAVLSHFLNSQANLPAAVQEIADLLKEEVSASVKKSRKASSK